jgi:hypothetical protein
MVEVDLKSAPEGCRMSWTIPLSDVLVIVVVSFGIERFGFVDVERLNELSG